MDSKEIKQVGIYLLEWNDDNQISIASVGTDRKGRLWFAPTNWLEVPCYEWDRVEKAILLTTQHDAQQNYNRLKQLKVLCHTLGTPERVLMGVAETPHPIIDCNVQPSKPIGSCVICHEAVHPSCSNYGKEGEWYCSSVCYAKRNDNPCKESKIDFVAVDGKWFVLKDAPDPLTREERLATYATPESRALYYPDRIFTDMGISCRDGGNCLDSNKGGFQICVKCGKTARDIVIERDSIPIIAIERNNTPIIDEVTNIVDMGVECIHGGNCITKGGLCCHNCGRGMRDVIVSRRSGALSHYDMQVQRKKKGLSYDCRPKPDNHPIKQQTFQVVNVTPTEAWQVPPVVHDDPQPDVIR